MRPFFEAVPGPTAWVSGYIVSVGWDQMDPIIRNDITRRPSNCGVRRQTPSDGGQQTR